MLYTQKMGSEVNGSAWWWRFEVIKVKTRRETGMNVLRWQIKKTKKQGVVPIKSTQVSKHVKYQVNGG